MIVVNLFGAPDAGQSIGAAYVFSTLQLRKVNVKLINFQHPTGRGQHQTGLFGRKHESLVGAEFEKYDVVVTDSPLFNCVLYNGYPALSPEFDVLVRKAFDSFHNMNYFVSKERPKAAPRRFGSQREKDDLSKTLRQQLSVMRIPFCNIAANQDGYDRIVEDVMAQLRKKEEFEQEDYED